MSSSVVNAGERAGAATRAAALPASDYCYKTGYRCAQLLLAGKFGGSLLHKGFYPSPMVGGHDRLILHFALQRQG